MSAKRSRSGSILMEFIIVAPLMFLFISMILQFAHIWMARQMTAYAAYCATRAILCVPPGEQKKAAENAAEMVLAWFSFVNLPGAALAGSDTSTVSSTPVHVGRLHNREDISADETVTFNDGLPYEREIMIPGWGGIPGSDSAKIRRKVFVINGGYTKTEHSVKPYAAVKVVFKFPLLMPLTGRMLSWFGGHPEEEIADDGRYHLLRGWNGDETVLDESGNLVSRSGARWGQDGRFPVITLTETCLLPMPYSTANFPTGGYADDLPRGGD